LARRPRPLGSETAALAALPPDHVVDREQRGIQYARGSHDFDGFSQLWFDDVPSMSAAFATEQVQQLGEDEARFIGDLKLVTAIQHVVIPTPPGLPHQTDVDAHAASRRQLRGLPGRVVRCPFDRRPIPGLYAVGNDIASVMGGNYPGAGITLGPALTFGHIAGCHLAGAPTGLSDDPSFGGTARGDNGPSVEEDGVVVMGEVA
jgi:hypothetical protein